MQITQVNDNFVYSNFYNCGKNEGDSVKGEYSGKTGGKGR